MSRTRAFVFGAATVLGLASLSVANAHQGGYYNDGKRLKYSHADGILPYQLTADQKMQFEIFASGFENREKRIGRQRQVIPVPYFKVKLHTHYITGTELVISLRYLSHATATQRTYLKEWREPVPVSGDVEKTEWFNMGTQVPAGRYMIEAWFYEKKQSQDVRKKMWEPRDPTSDEKMRAGQAYDTAFFYMTPPCEYCKTTSQNEILVHGEAGDFKATATTDQQCKEEISLIDEQMQKVAAAWVSFTKAYERAVKGAKIEQNMFDDFARSREDLQAALKEVRATQVTFRDGWLFSRFPAAWDYVDGASRVVLESLVVLNLLVKYKAQTTNPDLVLGEEQIPQPTVEAGAVISTTTGQVERAKEDVRVIRSNIKVYFRKLQKEIDKKQ